MNMALCNFLLVELKLNLENIKIIKKLTSLNNSCYKICYLNKFYFVKIANSINNNLKVEKEIILLCSQLNIGPKLCYFSEVTGNLMTEWIDSTLPLEDEFSSCFFINNLINKLKILHNVKFKNIFNPFKEIESNINLCKKLNISLPNYIDALLNILKNIESYCSKNIDYGFCHNDLNPSNILLSKNNIYFVDYEFSGMNDIFFDLATLAWMMTDKGKKNLLNTYFKTVTKYHQKKLSYYLFVVKLWNASWSLLKSQDPNCNYNYKKGAEIIFDDLFSTSFSLL